MADTRAVHLVLVGLPGSGKSTIGAALALRLGRPFLDFDVEIARRCGQTVAEIFAQRGEAFFRDQERRLTDEIVEQGTGTPLVLSPGGGWITNRSLVARLRPFARIILLRVSPEVALARMGASVSVRPLLAEGNALERLRAIAAARESAYSAADIAVNAETIAPQQLVDKLALLASPQGVG